MSRTKLAIAAVLVGVLLLAGTASAEEEDMTVLTGSLLGHENGAYQAYTVTLPAGEDVFVTLSQHSSPCVPGDQAFGVWVYRDEPMPPHLHVDASVQTAACMRTLTVNSPSGGDATFMVYNYEPGVIADFALKITGATTAEVEAESVEVVIPEEEAATGGRFQ